MFEKHHPSVVENAVYDILECQNGKILIDAMIAADYEEAIAPEELTPELLGIAEGRRTIVRQLLKMHSNVAQRINESRAKNANLPQEIINQLKERKP